MRATLEERFLDKIMPEPNSGCWLWTGAVARGGYGRFKNDGRLVYAHRFSYEMAKGPIPEGLQVDHTCSVTCCVNPEHLEAVTPHENCRRTVDRGRWIGSRIAKTHCPAGHRYAGDNLYITVNGKHRVCRVCQASHQRAFRKRRAAREIVLPTHLID